MHLALLHLLCLGAQHPHSSITEIYVPESSGYLGLPGALESTRNRVDALNGPTEGPLGAKEAENASIGPFKGPLGARETGNKVLR